MIPNHPEQTAVYDLEYILKMLRDAADYAESDGDFQPLRKWLYELELAIQQDAPIPAC